MNGSELTNKQTINCAIQNAAMPNILFYEMATSALQYEILRTYVF